MKEPKDYSINEEPNTFWDAMGGTKGFFKEWWLGIVLIIAIALGLPELALAGFAVWGLANL